ncbi:hypothetical protein Ciccas_006171 [Cichlidogyrus casuarinus]|uniref:High-affinity choline transporter 1 n=1 Tax=Cichlidogyrus casuarinus TaxID=1844966 RepID=A0ABD2Q6K5_9PLAT
MSVNYWGIASIGFFYLFILLVGIWAARRQKKPPQGMTETEDVMLAGRNINVFVGIFTMTATWVGGGYINGTAEVLYNPNMGLAWCQAPIGYSLSLIIGGLFFATKMREEGYVTMLDPFQYKFGDFMTGLLFIPALMGEVFWSAAILSALGATLSVVIDIQMHYSIIASACIALIYTLFGGLYSVAYTDVVQLFCIFVGMWTCIPFAMMHENVMNGTITSHSDRWLGKIEPADISYYLDNLLMLTFGGIPWQVYFQRVLSSKSARRAKILSYVASFGCFVMAIPAVLIGIVASLTDWTRFETYRNRLAPDGTIRKEEQGMVLPLVLQYLCPQWVAVVGLGAVSAAVMSSADSSVLSAASMFARNVIKPVCWQSASEHQVIWTMRVMIFVVGALACLMGIYIPSIYGLWSMCSDLVYVILFPQLVSVLYIKFSNTYGSLAGYLVGLFLRLGTGEMLLKLPPLFIFPHFQPPTEQSPDEFYQRFPTKTFAMLISFLTIVLVSKLFDFLFQTGKLDKKYDFLKSYVDGARTAQQQHKEEDKDDPEEVTMLPIPDDGKVFEIALNSQE